MWHDTLTTLRLRLRALLRGRQLDRDLEEEMAFHLAMREEAHRAAGLGAEEARAAARRGFGNVLLLREVCRELWKFRLLDQLAQDLRYAFRLFHRNPGSTLGLVVGLALGVGLNTVAFSAADSVLLRPLPFPNPDRLVVIGGASHSRDHDTLEWFGQASAIEAIASYQVGAGTLSGTEAPMRTRMAEVSASLFRVLRVAPLLGRAFTADDDKAGAPRVALISNGLWLDAFGGDEEILGRSIAIEGYPHSVVGVLPAGFSFPENAQVWMPRGTKGSVGLSLESPEGSEKGQLSSGLVARLRAGATRQQALSQVAVLQRRQEKPVAHSHVSLRGLHEAMVGDARPSLLLLLGGSIFVLLIGCANTASLLLERSEARRREMAMRATLGAGRARLARQVLVESLILCMIVAAASLVLAHWGIAALRPSLDAFVPAGLSLRLDGRVFSFALAASLATGLLAGLAPAWYGSRYDVRTNLNGRPRGSSTVGRNWGRGALVVGEVSAAVVLLVCAGLMLKSLARVQERTARTLGFEPGGVVAFDVSLPNALYGPSRLAQFQGDVLDRLSALPGVESAAATNMLPFGLQAYQWFETTRGSEPEAGGDMASVYAVSPAFWKTLRIPLRAGRLLTSSDAKGALVSEDLAKRFWPGRYPLGRHVRLPNDEDPRPVIGIVGHVRATQMDDDYPQIYILSDGGTPSQTFVVRSSGDPASVAGSLRAIVASVDKTLPLSSLATLDGLIARSVASRRARSELLSIFAALAAVLAGLGIYCVIAYAVTLRTQEIGVRQVLGAGPRDVLRLVVSQGALVISLGLGMGLALSVGFSRLLETFLFEVHPLDAPVYGAVAVLVSLVGIAACYVPARRALRINPATALRWE